MVDVTIELIVDGERHVARWDGATPQAAVDDCVNTYTEDGYTVNEVIQFVVIADDMTVNPISGTPIRR